MWFSIVIAAVVIFALAKGGILNAATCGMPAPPTAAIGNFAKAIATAEGFYVAGSRPARNNNPGDTILEGDAGRDCQGYGKFSSAALGWQALYSQLALIVNGQSRYYNLSMSILQMGNIYSPGSGPVWASNVASALGGSTMDSLAQWLTPGGCCCCC